MTKSALIPHSAGSAIVVNLVRLTSGSDKTRFEGVAERIHATVVTPDHAFCKKLNSAQAAVLSFANYNLICVHKTLRDTPAMAAYVTDRLLSLEEVVEKTSA